MKYIIVGMPRSGKTEFGRRLAYHLGTQATDTSDWLVDVEASRQNHMITNGLEVKDGWDEERDRPSRPYLIALGNAVCDTDPGFLALRAFDRGNVCVGVRRHIELVRVSQMFNRNLMVVYIQRPGCAEVDNLEIAPDECHQVIYNDGTLHDLDIQALHLSSQRNF